MTSPGSTKLRLLVLSAYPPGGGGGELQTQLQVAELARRGHTVEVVDLRGRSSGPAWDESAGVRVRRIVRPSVPLLAGIVFHLRLAWHLLASARTFDVAQINHIGPPAITSGLILGLFRVPRLVVIWGSARPGVGPFGRGWRSGWARRVCRGFERVVALSSDTVAHLERAGFERSRIVFVPNGVDARRFAPGDGDAGLGRVVTVGRLVPAKGLDVLLRAWERLAPLFPEARLHLVGDGPLRGELERLTETLGIGDSVTFVGNTTEVPARLRNADVYVSASRTEGMSNALLEAMSAGLPVVATQVGGAADLIAHGRQGFLVAPESQAELFEALRVLLADPEVRRSMGADARRRAMTEFSIEAIARRYEQEYLELAGARGKHDARTTRPRFAFDQLQPTIDVSVVIPVRNEIRHIDACLDSVLRQRLDGLKAEVIVVDGASDDGTSQRVLERSRDDARIRLLGNPDRKVSFALNIGMRASRGRVIVRMDAHALYADDYIVSSLAVLERTGAAAVGGLQVAIPGAEHAQARAIALAQQTFLGMGGGRHRRIGYDGEAESVWLGTFPRETVARAGGFDEDLFRSEDNDFFQRVRESGGRLWVSSTIRARYFCRSTLSALCRQYLATGEEIVPTLTRNRRALSLRHLAPGMCVIFALVSIGVLAAAPAPFPAAMLALISAVAATYLAVVAWVSVRTADGARTALWMIATFLTLHLSYGAGTLVGAIKTPRRILKRRARSESCGLATRPAL